MNPLRVTALSIIAPLLFVGACSQARLMQGMLGASEPNEMVLGQLFAVGGGGKADIGSDGVARDGDDRGRGRSPRRGKARSPATAPAVA